MISAVVLVMENISNTYQTLAITFRNQAFEIATISGTTNATDISRLVSESTEACTFKISSPHKTKYSVANAVAKQPSVQRLRVGALLSLNLASCPPP